ncbi:MAG TPA: response regulator transcription factor [Ktedonobacteraceae bacterium]|nr:response regulator transcription factor [Ktedonobacteraceae bacterium]
MKQILIASDSPIFIHTLEHRLAPYGIEVLAAHSGEQALQVIRHHSLELVVLSQQLPDLHSNEVCRLIRDEGYTDLPVILLNEGGELHDILAGLESGANSVLPWPLSDDELIERIRARLRYAKSRGGEHQLLRVGNLIFDTEEHQAWCKGQRLALSEREYELLKLLASNAGHVLTKEAIYEHIWGPEATATPQSIKVYINMLRKKLSACGEEHIIQAVRFIGYVLKP